MSKLVSSCLALGLVLGLVGLAVYYLGFGQTFEGTVTLSAGAEEPDVVGQVTFQSRFRHRRFLTHSVYLDLPAGTPTTYRGEIIEAAQAVAQFSGAEIEARVGYREDRPGWGQVVSLDLEPPGSSPKEILLIVSLLLIFGCTGGMAIAAKAGD